MMQRITLITLSLIFLFSIPVQAKKKKSDQCKKWRWNLQADDSTGKRHRLSNFSEPVLLLVYAGKNSADTNVKAHDELKKDKDLKKGGRLSKMFRAFGIANYQETWVPNWIISMLIKRKIEKYGVIIWNDKDNCFSGRGESSDCVGKKKRRLFTDNKQNNTILYDRYYVKNLVGRVNPGRFHKFIKALAEAAEKKRDICWVKKNIEY